MCPMDSNVVMHIINDKKTKELIWHRDQYFHGNAFVGPKFKLYKLKSQSASFSYILFLMLNIFHLFHIAINCISYCKKFKLHSFS